MIIASLKRKTNILPILLACMEEKIPLGMKQIQEQLSRLQGWEIEEGKLEKEFRFPSFKAASEFVSKLANISEEQGHHPDIYWWYDKIKIVLFTHTIKSLSLDDFILAGKIDKI